MKKILEYKYIFIKKSQQRKNCFNSLILKELNFNFNFFFLKSIPAQNFPLEKYILINLNYFKITYFENLSVIFNINHLKRFKNLEKI